METPTAFSLEASLESWRKRMGQRPEISAQNLEELDSHLRDSVDRLRGAGLSDEEAWIIAQKRLGRADDLATEFTKMHTAADPEEEAPSVARNRSMIAIGVGFATTVALCRAGETWAARVEFDAEKVAWTLDVFAALGGGYVTGLVARRFPVRHALRAAAILTPFVICISLLGGMPFASEVLWGRVWPGIVMGIIMCVGAALVECQRSNRVRGYLRNAATFLWNHWSLSGGPAID